MFPVVAFFGGTLNLCVFAASDVTSALLYILKRQADSARTERIAVVTLLDVERYQL